MATEIQMRRRDTILLAAKQEFSAQGYERAKMEEIAKRAGIGKSTIYEYFPSKKELLFSVMEAIMQFMLEKLQGIMGKDASFKEKFTTLLTESEYANDWQFENLVTMLKMCQTSPLPDYLEKHANDFIEAGLDIIADAVQQAQQSGELRNGLDKTALARLIFIILVESSHQFGIYHTREISMTIQMLYQGIGNHS